MRVLVTGATGQLGRALKRQQPAWLSGAEHQVVFASRSGVDADCQLDLTDPSRCFQAIDEIHPDWVINAAAYTSVDRAEQDCDLAYAVNAQAPRAFAQALDAIGGNMLQISTDFVFNGSQSVPYHPTADRDPLGVYGASKASGEDAVLQILGPERATVLRTSWVYGPVGHNFMLTMLRLHRERQQISVVDDQIGSPTSASGLAECCWQLLEKRIYGVQHWSDAGVASWYDFAVAIGELAVKYQLVEAAANVQPIPSSMYPTQAKRPSYSVLDCSPTRQALQINVKNWRSALDQVLGCLHKYIYQ